MIGYWGNPLEIGGRCEKCECSTNIDLRDPLSCDQSTGECVRCINHAAGEHCEKCMEWYYGDAVNLKNCQRTLRCCVTLLLSFIVLYHYHHHHHHYYYYYYYYTAIYKAP